MWLQIVFKQSTRESKTKLNFGFINQKVLSSLLESNHRCFNETVDLTALTTFLPALHEIKKACAHSEPLPGGFCVCIECIDAGPVLHTGAVTWVMDVACYLQVIQIIFTVAQNTLEIVIVYFQSSRYLSARTHGKILALSLPSQTRQGKKKPHHRHYSSTFFPLLQSSLLRTVIHFSSLCVPQLRLFFPLPSHYGGSCYPSEVMASCCDAPSGCVWDSVVGWHLAAPDKRASEPCCSF